MLSLELTMHIKLFRSIQSFFVLIFFSLFSSTSNAIEILEFSDCGAASVSKKNGVSIYGDENQELTGWNHIDLESSEFSSLKLSDDQYGIRQTKIQVDKKCLVSEISEIALVVKLADWTRQHANGIEIILDDKNVPFSDLQALAIDLRLNRDATNIPTTDLIKTRYGHDFSDSQLENLDRGKVNLGVVFFEQGALDQSSESLNIETIFEIDQFQYFDKWIRVVLPISVFNVFTERDYKRTSIALNDVPEARIFGFRMVAETSQGKQLRNLVGNEWDESTTETFKQISLSIRNIELLKSSKK